MKICELSPECKFEVYSEHRHDAGAHLCVTHFYALCMIEQKSFRLDMPEGPRRNYFINAVKIIAEAQRRHLVAWRIAHP